MTIAIITGSNGLIGSESVRFFSNKFNKIIGIDNNFRQKFFGKKASTKWLGRKLEKEIINYVNFEINIADKKKIFNLFNTFSKDIKLIIHTAAQPSHDWAANNPHLDFDVNAFGTLNLLEATRRYCPDAIFIFTSTNKVYGDSPNFIKLKELKSRYEATENKFYDGIDENFQIDQSKHSLFGCSKLSADIYTQEYGKYFGLKTGIFRGGCLTGPQHSGVELHGFLSYLVKCNLLKEKYTIFGYKGKQVRDNIHSSDLISMFNEFYQSPKKGEVFNCGGGRANSCSVLEAIKIIESISNIKMRYSISKKNRIGDHKWYITNFKKFNNYYPDWKQKYNLKLIIKEIIDNINL